VRQMRWKRCAAAPAALAVALIMSACGPKPQPATAPATRPAVATTRRAPLPPEALWQLDQLKPAIVKPVNAAVEELPERVAKELAEAAKLSAKRNYAGAVGRLERALGFRPEHPRILRALGVAYARLRNRGKALANLRRAAKVAPDDVELHLLLGRLYLAQKLSAPALLALRTAIVCSDAVATNPVAAEARLALAELLYRQGYSTASAECFATLAEWIDRHGRAYADRPTLRTLVLRPEVLLRRRGQILMQLRRPAEAAAMFRRAYDRDRSSPVGGRLLIEALLAAGQLAKAEAVFIDMAGEPEQRSQLGPLAGAIAAAAKDKKTPGRLWKAYRSAHPVNASLAASLARAAVRLGDPAEAESILVVALKAKPGSVELARLLAQTYLRQGAPDRALGVLAELLAVDESAVGIVRASVRRVAASGLAEEFEIRFADQANRDKGPIRHARQYVAGELALARGKKILAAEQFRKAAASGKGFHIADEALMEIFVQRGRYDQAERLVRQLIRQSPEGYFPQYLAGKLALAQHKADQAVKALETARERNAKHLPTLLALADAYLRVAAPTKAASVLQAAIVAKPSDGQAYRLLFRFYVDRRDYRSARSVAQALARRRPTGLQAKLLEAELALAAGQLGEARKRVDQLRDSHPGDPEVRLLSIEVDLAAHPGVPTKARFDRMVRRLRVLTREQPKSVRALRLLARVLSLPGEYDAAAQVWQRIYEVTSQRPDSARAYAAVLTLAVQDGRAIEVLKKLTERKPDQLGLLRTLVRLLAKGKRLDEAAKYGGRAQQLLDKQIAEAKTDRQKNFLRAQKQDYYVLARQFDEAVDYVRRQVKAHAGKDVGQDVLVYRLMEAKRQKQALGLAAEWLVGKSGAAADSLRDMRIILLGELGQFDKASAEARKWIAASPDELRPRRSMVAMLAAAKKYARAMAVVDGWIREQTAGPVPATAPSTQPKAAPARAPAPPSALLRWCRETAVRMLLLQQKYDEALARADRYLRADPKSADLLNLKASCLAEKGKRKEALPLLEQAHKLTPNDPGANNNLGYSYAEMGVELARAEEMIHRAVRRRPGVTAYQDSLAWVLYKTGRFGRAGAIFVAILASQTDEEIDHPVILDHAGDVFYRLGWADRAVDLWRRAVKKAKAEALHGREIVELLKWTPKKVRAVRAGREPAVAPVVTKADAEKDAKTTK